MKAYDLIAEALCTEDVHAIFGVLGDGNLPFWGAVATDTPIAVYSARHEAAAVAMADGFSRISGGVGVATVTHGPGLTHTATALIGAARSRSAVVVLVGDLPAADRTHLQRFDHRLFAETCGAAFITVANPRNVPNDIRDAFYLAQRAKKPVVLNIPIDIQEMEIDEPFRHHPSRQFLPSPHALEPTQADLDILTEALIQAELPVFVAGRGAIMANAREAIVALGDRAGALLTSTLLAKGFFAEHPFDAGIVGGYASRITEELVSQADLIIGFGAAIGPFTRDGGIAASNARIIRVDSNEHPQVIDQLSDRYIRADARLTAEMLSAELESKSVQRLGFRRESIMRALSRGQIEAEKPSDGMDPRVVMSKLSASLPNDVVIICGMGHFQAFPGMYATLPSSAILDYAFGFAAIGVAMPMSIGIKVAAPDRPCLVIEGDGSLMPCLPELETIVRHGLSIVILIINDSGYGAEMHKMRAHGFDPSLATWPSPDFVAIARAVGGDGQIVTDENDISSAVTRGFEAAGLFIVDARVSRAIVNDRYQKVFFGRPNTAPLLRPTARR